MMSALMTDLIEETVDHRVANAVVGASKQLIRVAELQLRARGSFRQAGGEAPQRVEGAPFQLLE